jgi:hypothetical protein
LLLLRLLLLALPLLKWTFQALFDELPFGEADQKFDAGPAEFLKQAASMR